MGARECARAFSALRSAGVTRFSVPGPDIVFGVAQEQRLAQDPVIGKLHEKAVVDVDLVFHPVFPHVALLPVEPSDVAGRTEKHAHVLGGGSPATSLFRFSTVRRCSIGGSGAMRTA